MKHIRLKELIYLAIIIISCLSLNFYLFNQGYHYYDVKAQESWGNTALEKGVSYLYVNHLTDYPPLYQYVLKFNSWINLVLFGSKEVLTNHYVFISKIIPTICNLFIGLVLFFYIKKRKGLTLAFIGMCLYVFNPAMIYNTAYWGQVDSVNTLFMFLSLFFLMRKQFYVSSILIVLGVFIKIQSIVLVPIIFSMILFEGGCKKVLKTMTMDIIILGILLLPYLASGAMSDVLDICFKSVGNYPFVTVNAYNFWFLVSPVSPDWYHTLSDQSMIFGFSLKSVGLFSLGIFTLLVLYQMYKQRDEKTMILAASSIAIAFFIIPTQIHERYLFPFFALFMLMALNNKKYLICYIILSITFLFNLILVLEFDGDNMRFIIFRSVLIMLTESPGFVNLAIIVSIINVLTFIYLIKIGIMNGIVNNLKQDYLKIRDNVYSKR